MSFYFNLYGLVEYKSEPSHLDISTPNKSLTFDLEKHYGFAFEIISKHGYNGDGSCCMEQNIETHENSTPHFSKEGLYFQPPPPYTSSPPLYNTYICSSYKEEGLFPTPKFSSK